MHAKGYFMRLLMSLRAAVDKVVVIRYADRPPDNASTHRRFLTELAEFSSSQYKLLEHLEADASPETRQAAIGRHRGNGIVFLAW